MPLPTLTRGSPAFFAASVVMLLVLGTGFGLTFSLSKMATEVVEPGTFVFYQALATGLIIALVLQARRKLYPFPRRFLWLCPLLGLVSFVLPNVLFITAIKHLPAGLASVVLSTSPFFAYLLALSFRSERFSAQRIGGLAIGFAGVLCLVVPESALPSPELLPWLLLCLAPPLAYASANYTLERLMPEDGSALQYTALSMLCAALFCLPLYWMEGGSYLPNYATRGDVAMVAMMLISAANFAMLFTLLSWRGAVFTSQVGNIVTLTGLAWGWLFFGETLTPWMIAATALIIAGVLLVNATRRRKPKGEPETASARP